MLNIKDIGQLFITGISGLALTSEEAAFIEKNNIGGIILFKYNYSDPAQLAELVNSIQKLRDDFPLFISVDQEGGRVRRFQTQFTQFPAMLEIGDKNSPKLTYEVHNLMAKELIACGVNLDYSPCCDILTNDKNQVIGDRAFGRDADTVEKHISAAIRGLQSNGVMACAKHFPGHGDTTKDSHFHLPYITKSKEELLEVEVKTFQKASKARVEFMMMAHLVVDCIDKDLPATLSKPAYDFLREECKFKKLIITDDMEMHAITKHFGVEDAAVKAINAGADIVLYRSLEQCEAAFNAVKEATRKRTIKHIDIEEKIKRVFNVKKAFLSDYKPIYIPDIKKSFKTNESSQLTDILN